MELHKRRHDAAQLAERYATPLPQMQDELAALEAKVARHLANMGFAA